MFLSSQTYNTRIIIYYLNYIIAQSTVIKWKGSISWLAYAFESVLISGDFNIIFWHFFGNGLP